MDVRVGQWRKLSAEELMLLNCGVGEDSWESHALKEIQPVHPKGDQSCVFIGRTDVEAETPVLWPPHEKSWLIGKDCDAGRDWAQVEKGTTEDEMAGWHHWLNGRESEWTPGVGDGQWGLACCISWGCKESDKTERLNWTELTDTIQTVYLRIIIGEETILLFKFNEPDVFLCHLSLICMSYQYFLAFSHKYWGLSHFSHT